MRRAAWIASLLLVPLPAQATPKALPFTYGSDTTPKGQGEVEQYVDLDPVRARAAATGAPTRMLATQLQTEVEYGLTDRVELGLYLTLAPGADGFTDVPTLPEGNGSKQRVRFRFADPGDWPIDLALYAEIAETSAELELEGKLILERRFGDVRLLANAWVEYEIYFDGRRDWVFNPTAGLSVQITPSFFAGVEYWMRAEVLSEGSGAASFNDGPHHYVGPALKLSLGNFFCEAGLYLRASNFGHVMQPGEAYGPTWLRTIVGFAF